ncbi:hypothetical protein VE00_09799 [Pseudogymnoascus sp. WSF 3629]|nr:hypothetical protein VE00_09799 [Pseudogymnoascus sp. WSF 3629]
MVELYAAFTVLSMDNGTRDAIIITLAGILSHLVWYVVKHSWKACFGNLETQKPHSDVRNSKTDNGEQESKVIPSKLKHGEPSKAIPNTSPVEKLHNETDEFLDGLSKPERLELLNVARGNERRLESLRKERDDALKQRDDSFKHREDQYLKHRDNAREDRNSAREDRNDDRKRRDEAYRDRDDACKQRDQAYKERDDARKQRDGAY